MSDFSVPIILKEKSGFARRKEAVSIGIPLPKKAVLKCSELVLFAQNGECIPCEVRPLAFWQDGSIRWILVHFFATVDPYSCETYELRTCEEINKLSDLVKEGVRVEENLEYFSVNTSTSIFFIPKQVFSPFKSVIVGNKKILSVSGSETRVQDANGRSLIPQVDSFKIEENGLLRCALMARGRFVKEGRPEPFAHFFARLVFWKALSVVLCEIGIHNPRPALHPGGLWDLGDPGSIYFKEMSLNLKAGQHVESIEWKTRPRDKTHRTKEPRWSLYQDSSGGENWNSPNHVDCHGKSTVSFRGYTITTGDHKGAIESGQRATPLVKLNMAEGWMAATIQEFWQNFPKSLEVTGNELTIGLFPNRKSRPYELQGGEKKRHILLLDFGQHGQDTIIPCLQAPLQVSIPAEWVERTGAISYFLPEDRDPNSKYKQYVRNIIDGPHSFFNKREVIDEYGWRNFGDIFADHEAVHARDRSKFVSHYNNQYDFIYGAGVHFLRSGDYRWYELMAQYARHIIDIDIYHTDQDKAAFNHGLFWHTDHYKKAETCTHRGFSGKNSAGGFFRSSYGGGPCNEHNYTSGLLLYYYLSGDHEARRAVLELADWVLSMDDGSKTVLGLLDEGPTGLASQTAEIGYHGPGRGSANSINALIDAYLLTDQRRYLAKAEELIQRCIHPHDDIESLRLDDPEHRWSYLVFLQVLGKYLDLKLEIGETGYHFHYARSSLLHYADWMVENEVPYKEVLHKVDIPTETWPAQDIRKCHILHLACKYARSTEKKKYFEKACFFFDRCMDDLLSFETAYLTRPLVILCVFGFVHGYFLRCSDQSPEFHDHNYYFGNPQQFVPQRLRFKRIFRNKLNESSKFIKRMLKAQLYKFKKR